MKNFLEKLLAILKKIFVNDFMFSVYDIMLNIVAIVAIYIGMSKMVNEPINLFSLIWVFITLVGTSVLKYIHIK